MVYSSVRDSVSGMLTLRARFPCALSAHEDDRARIAAGEKKERAPGEYLPEALKTAHGSLGDDPRCCSYSWEISRYIVI